MFNVAQAKTGFSLNLPSTIALVSKQIKQMGRWAFIRYCKNLGMSFEDTYVLMFNKMPRG